MTQNTYFDRPRIGIDFHVVDGIFQGSRTHVLELFSEVIRISPDMQFFIFLENTDFLKKFSTVFSAPNVELIRMPHVNPIMRLCWQLPMLQAKYKLNILHTQYILPAPGFYAGVVTIHDVLFESHPQYFPFLFRLRSNILMRLSALFSRHIFTVSEFSRAEIMSRYKTPQHKISVIYNGFEKSRFYAGDDGQEIVEKRGLISKGYLLSVGRLEPRKNYLTLIRSYARLLDVKLPLVIIGQPHFGFDEVFQTIRKLNLENRIIVLSDIQDHELPAFYRHAKLFIYPTWAEGFGMPLLEAMASGVPVISSNTTSIPEVVGDAGILVDPNDFLALGNVIQRLLSDNQLYQEIKEKGFQRVKLFTWHESAQIVRKVYESIYGKLINKNSCMK